MIESILRDMADLISRGGISAPLVALAAGIITAVTPCSLSQLPLVLAYVGGEESPAKAFRLSVVYSIGLAVTFTAFGAAAALIGNLIGNAGKIWYLILGALMTLMSLQILGIFSIVPSTYLSAMNKRRGYPGALIAGILGGIFSSPCSTPVIIALLTVIAAEGTMAKGILLMLLYALGSASLSLILGFSPSLIRKLGRSEKMHRVSAALNAVLGISVLALGLYMLYLGF